MKYIHTPLILLLLMTQFACTKDRVRPSGTLSSQFYSASDVTAISVGSGMTLELSDAAVEDIEILAPDNLQPYISTSVQGGDFSVQLSGVNVLGNSNITVRVKSDQLIAASLSGGATLITQGVLQYPDFNLSLSGGSKGTLNYQGQNLSLDLSGGAKLGASGSSVVLELSQSGGSKLNAYDLITEDLQAQLSGGSKATLTVSQNLSVSASGGSKLTYKGAGQIVEQNLSGGSKIEHL